MMVNLKDLHPAYIIDKNGDKKSIIFSISDFRELIEDIEDLALVAERREEPTVSHKELLSELKKDGLL